jgi:hypothetical protein
MSKREDPWNDLPASERLERKLRMFGDDALLDYEEAAIVWDVGGTSAKEILETLPCVHPLPRVRRWRYGTMRDHARKLEQAA